MSHFNEKNPVYILIKIQMCNPRSPLQWDCLNQTKSRTLNSAIHALMREGHTLEAASISFIKLHTYGSKIILCPHLKVLMLQFL